MRYALAGLASAWRCEAAFRQELWALALMVPLAFLLADSVVQWLLLVGPLVLVLIAELLNSAIEALADLWGDERRELIGRAKDMAAAAVLLSICLCLVAWGAVAALRICRYTGGC